MKPCELIKEARTWHGTPYQHQGRTRHGVDCVGLAIRVAQDLGLTEFDIREYERTPSNKLMKDLLMQNCILVNGSPLQPAMLLHMAFEKQPRHIAIVTSAEPLRIIHASSEHERVVEHVVDQKWRNRIRGAYMIPGVDYD